ncbi:hypothetical protein [Streptomyces sp. 1331.2]|uniref:hypothetical protein n=1 Tax=Streptomyces sp. 1331.2 TaxID=1938835 RepID=UPI000BD25D50|nr:hypothetical protein [Streptomyces sp. 1331.2]SOB85519.1 hypothetical protein SAMN06272789_5807 [Streptomyces sp. 1331.2]
MTHNPPRTAKTTGRTTARRWTAALAATTAALLGATALAAADTTPPADNSAAPPAVEDFSYPGATAITRVKLIRGDGHILLGDCAKPTQIQIWTRAPGNPDNKICFTADGTTGSLTLQLPDVFALQTTGRAIRAGLTAGTATQTLDIPKDGFKGTGEGTGSAPTSLVELTVTG